VWGGIARILDGKCKVKGSAETGIDPPHTLKGQHKGQHNREKLHAQIRVVRLTELYTVQYSQYIQYSTVQYIYVQSTINAACCSCAGILEQSMRARNQTGIGLSYRRARLHRLTESIPGILKSLKIPSLFT
jgi:hypothetical protein